MAAPCVRVNLEMKNVTVEPQKMLAAKSVDMARVIRQSIRCFVFGALGAIPLIGIGLAIQALRLHRKVLAEMGGTWRPPPLYWYWLIGLLYLWAYRELFGDVGTLSIFLIIGGLQTYHLWRSFSPAPRWNPGERHLFWGAALAYLGCFGSLAMVGAVGLWIVMTTW